MEYMDLEQCPHYPPLNIGDAKFQKL